jgi:hypothetical protein
LRTGTYKLVFKLYDNNTFIGDVTRYIIIKWGWQHGRKNKRIIW